MCLSGLFGGKPKQAKVPDPIIVAPPAEPTPEAPIQSSATDDLSSRSKGKRSLRIALNIANPSSGGINVPGA